MSDDRILDAEEVADAMAHARMRGDHRPEVLASHELLRRDRDEAREQLRATQTERDETQARLTGARRACDNYRTLYSQAVDALRTAAEGLAKYEPDPQHYTVTARAVLGGSEHER